MARRDEKGNWIDQSGAHVPPKYVDQVDKKRDKMVEKLFRNAQKQHEQLQKFKAATLEEIGQYLDWLAEKYGEKKLNPGGNYSLDTFSGDKRVYIKVNKSITFDERLQVAKQKIDSCLQRWSKGAHENLKVVVTEAFQVDKKGNVDTRRILGLRRWKIKDAEWKSAMDLITEALTVTGSKRYLMFQTRENPKSEWQTVRLDLAGV